MNKPNKTFYERPKHLQNKSAANTSIPPAPVKISDTYTYSTAFESQNNSTSKIKSLIVNGVLVILSVIFVILSVAAIGQIADMNYSWTRDEDDFWYSISDGYYTDIVESAYHNQNEGVNLTPGLEQCYAVARYFEAASFYKVAVHMGDTEDIAKYSAVMEECLSYMDDILYIAEDINMKLGIE